APLALVHRLHSGDGNAVALLDQVRVQTLWRRHVRGPRIAVAELGQGGANGEVGRCHVVEVVPCQRERDGGAWSDTGAVGGDDGGPARSRRVDEDLAAAVLLHECRRGDGGIETGSAQRDGAGGGGGVGRIR